MARPPKTDAPSFAALQREFLVLPANERGEVAAALVRVDGERAIELMLRETGPVPKDPQLAEVLIRALMHSRHADRAEPALIELLLAGHGRIMNAPKRVRAAVAARSLEDDNPTRLHELMRHKPWNKALALRSLLARHTVAGDEVHHARLSVLVRLYPAAPCPAGEDPPTVLLRVALAEGRDVFSEVAPSLLAMPEAWRVAIVRAALEDFRNMLDHPNRDAAMRWLYARRADEGSRAWIARALIEYCLYARELFSERNYERNLTIVSCVRGLRYEDEVLPAVERSLVHQPHRSEGLLRVLFMAQPALRDWAAGLTGELASDARRILDLPG